MDPSTEISPSTLLLLDEMRKLFAEQAARWDRRFADLHAARPDDIVPVDALVTSSRLDAPNNVVPEVAQIREEQHADGNQDSGERKPTVLPEGASTSVLRLDYVERKYILHGDAAFTDEPDPGVVADQATLDAAECPHRLAAALGDIVALDRLSLLPDVILRDIVSRLPLKDAARTAVLSRRWQPLCAVSSESLVRSDPVFPMLFPKCEGFGVDGICGDELFRPRGRATRAGYAHSRTVGHRGRGPRRRRLPPRLLIRGCRPRLRARALLPQTGAERVPTRRREGCAHGALPDATTLPRLSEQALTMELLQRGPIDIESTFNMELALGATGTAATLSDFSITPRPVNHGAPTNRSTKCPGGAVDVLTPVAASAVAMAPVIISSRAADAPTAIDAACSIITFDVDSSASVIISGMPDVLPVSVKVLDGDLFICGGDFLKLCACNLIDVPVVLGRIYVVNVVQLGQFPSFDWLEQQPWPPPHEQVEFKCGSASIRPSPWPSFLLGNGCSLSWVVCWKPPWPLQPRQDMVNTVTVEAEAHAVYLKARESMLKQVGNISGKVTNLTVQSWATSQTLGYISLAGQFIDSEWKLHQRMLSLVVISWSYSENAVTEATGGSLPWPPPLSTWIWSQLSANCVLSCWDSIHCSAYVTILPMLSRGKGFKFRMLNEEESPCDAVLLVFASKPDLPNDAAEISDQLGLHSLCQRHCYIENTCAPTGYFYGLAMEEEHHVDSYRSIQSGFSFISCCRWDAVPYRQHWPPPVQFEIQVASVQCSFLDSADIGTSPWLFPAVVWLSNWLCFHLLWKPPWQLPSLARFIDGGRPTGLVVDHSSGISMQLMKGYGAALLMQAGVVLLSMQWPFSSYFGVDKKSKLWLFLGWNSGLNIVSKLVKEAWGQASIQGEGNISYMGQCYAMGRHMHPLL